LVASHQLGKRVLIVIEQHPRNQIWVRQGHVM
jgi:hypothetical protein